MEHIGDNEEHPRKCIVHCALFVIEDDSDVFWQSLLEILFAKREALNVGMSEISRISKMVFAST